MEIVHKLTKEEMCEILTKELGITPVSIVLSSDGEFIITSNQDLHKKNEKNNTNCNNLRPTLSAKYGDEKAEKIIKFFDELFKDLKENTSEKFPNSVFFYTLNDDGSKKVWMEHDSKYGNLWCLWNGFWSFFENEIGLDHIEIQSLVKTMVEQHLNREVGTPGVYHLIHQYGWNNI
jgi:hypothetical protein